MFTETQDYSPTLCLNEQKMRFPLRACVENTDHAVETQWLSVKG